MIIQNFHSDEQFMECIVDLVERGLGFEVDYAHQVIKLTGAN